MVVLLETGESPGTFLSGTGVAEGTAAARTTVLTQSWEEERNTLNDAFFSHSDVLLVLPGVTHRVVGGRGSLDDAVRMGRVGWRVGLQRQMESDQHFLDSLPP